jgi:hypothetical protein
MYGVHAGACATHTALSGCLVKMERLRVEFCRECFDPLFINPIRAGREPLADIQVVQKETLVVVHRHSFTMGLTIKCSEGMTMMHERVTAQDGSSFLALRRSRYWR